MGYRYIQIHTGTYRYIQVRTGTYRYIQVRKVHTGTYRYVQVRTGTYRYVQVHTGTYIYIQVRTGTYVSLTNGQFVLKPNNPSNYNSRFARQFGYKHTFCPNVVSTSLFLHFVQKHYMLNFWSVNDVSSSFCLQ